MNEKDMLKIHKYILSLRDEEPLNGDDLEDLFKYLKTANGED